MAQTSSSRLSPPTLASSANRFSGLAPWLRKSIAGTDFLPDAKSLMQAAEQHPEDANLWMNLSTALFCLGQREIALAAQAQALAMQRVFYLAAAEQPAQLRLLLLMVPGDLAANTPLDCLLEHSAIELIYCYLSPDATVLTPFPEHDAVMVAMGDADENRALLALLSQSLLDWPKPVINLPQNIAHTDRMTASHLLQNIPGLLMPLTLRVTRSELQAITTDNMRLSRQFVACDYPLILRPLGSQGGRDLRKVECADEVTAYLAQVSGEDFFISRFIDYSAEDGLFRKFRIALIDGQAYACHMAISSNWMIHYVNAAMYEEVQKREEEAQFMANFEDFARRHGAALEGICRKMGLDYICLDCAETQDGQLLVFEVDHVMVVHAMDPVAMFPYKPVHIQKIEKAFRNLLFSRIAG